MIRKLITVSIYLLPAIYSNAQEKPEGDSVLRSFFSNRKYDYPIDYSNISTINCKVIEPTCEKISSYNLLLLRREDRLSVTFELAEICKRIIDTIKILNLDKDIKNPCVYREPVMYWNTFYRCYMVRVKLIAYVYAEDDRYRYNKWSRAPENKNIYSKLVKEHYFKLDL